METTEAALQTKLIQLKITVERTSKILDTGNREAIERHQKALKALITEADQYKRDEEAKKIVSKQDLTEIGEWNAEIETKLANADHEINRLKQWCDEYKQECDEVQKKQELEFERQLFETRLKFQNELHAAKANQEAQLSKQTTTAPVEATKGSQAKLPKLVITKFNGTCQDWPRFWEQFRETVDKTGIEPVIKFAYLRELLDSKVRRSVEALPFTSEGYNRATSILEERYGKQSEIIKAYNMQILDLPTIPNANVRRIHEFTDKLTYSVQSLETLGKLQQVNGNVAMTLDKLPGIRGDLVRTDDSWETWDFVKLTEALRLWTRRNPIEKTVNDKSNDRSNKLYNTRRQDHKPRECIYCEDASHKPNECPNVTSVTERRQILQKRRLCFNCTGTAHRAAECQSKAKCQKCDRRHHTSICDKKDKAEGIKEEKLLISTGESAEGSFPIVKIKVDGIECRALIDSGAGSSYASAKLINLLQKKPIKAKEVRVDMLMSTQLIHLETYGTVIESVNGEFKLEVNLVKVNKEKLLSVDNPCYKELIKKYPHLKGVEVDDHDTKAQLPVHVVLSSGEYARIKTSTKPRVGQDGEPIAELTKLGWFVMSPGKEFDHNKMLMTQTSQTEYEELCRLDVLGLEDTPENDQESVYSEFKEQLVRDEQGWYETGLTWKGNHPELPTNKKGSLRRLDNLVRKLERTDKYNDYDEIITDQLREGVIEPAPEEPSKKEFYIPHKMVMKESGESTKLRVVYDASAREQLTAPSLNECLNPGPSLQNKLWNVLVRQRSYSVAVCGDIQKAFLQVRIKECERDALRFHWKHPGQDEVQVYRFTRALFGLTCSPFLLGGVINQHLEFWQSRQPEIVAELRQNLYVDDLLTGGNTIEETLAKKSSMVEILNDAAFKLHKWNANASELEEDGDTPKVNDEQTFAKQQLGVLQHESKVLGLPWDKTADTLTVQFPKDSAATTKRGILSKLAKIYDPLGLVSPITLLGKMIYRDVCDEKTSWDSQLSYTQAQRWKKWEETLPEGETVPRPLAPHREKIQSVTLHAFGDASNHGVSAVVYAVVEQPSGTTQTLVAAKSRLAKRGLTIPRLELVGAHMAVNLITNVHQALNSLLVIAQHCWLDSTVVLYWVQGRGKYKQFVANRVSKIQKHPNIVWHHVPTRENPADLGSRGTNQLDDLWRRGPQWIAEPENWPADPVIKSTVESQAEEKLEKEIYTCTIQETNEVNLFDALVSTHINNIWRALRICAWIDRFLRNTKRKPGDRVSGPLTTTEIQKQLTWWIQRVQQNPTNPDQFQKDCIQLNVQRNKEGILECRGRIVGQYPVYLPDTAPFTEGLVRQAHIDTLHGGVTLTMTRLRETYWIPRLRRLVKQVRRGCWGCKRFQAIAYASPPPGQLPITRTQGETPYQVVGVDFAGPIKYMVRAKTEGKAYLVLYACSLTRGVYLELLHTLETEEFLRCLKRFVARRGRPKVIYSDNGSTFKGAAKWIKKINKDEKFHNYLAQNSIEWKFNLSRAPWWGGQFERLVGIFKAAFYKTIGNGILSFNELSEVVIDVEVAINSRPLDYVEDDVQVPLLTPNSLLFLQPNQIPELEAHHIQEPDLRRRARCLSRIKDAMWSRWSKEYIRSLREKHRLQGEKEIQSPVIGEMVIIKGDEKNRNLWKLGKIVRLIHGRDGVVRGAKVQTGKGTLERTTQHLYPLELSCDTPTKKDQLNPEAPMFRPKRSAAKTAREKIKAIAADEQILD